MLKQSDYMHANRRNIHDCKPSHMVAGNGRNAQKEHASSNNRHLAKATNKVTIRQL